VGRRGKNHQFVLSPGNDFQIGSVAIAFDKADVQLELAEGGNDVAGVGDIQGQLALRMLPHESWR
jgi:hypothetical protein